METSRKAPRLIDGLVGLAFFTMAGTANATIIVDPGAVGTDLIATPSFLITTGDVVNDSFDIIWDEMKHVELRAGEIYEFLLFSPAFFNLQAYSIFLTDENGDEIPGTFASGLASTFPIPSFGPVIATDDLLIFHGIHFQFDNNTMLLNFLLPFDGQLALFTPARIGEWGKVPEPGTLGLLGAGLLGLAFARRRKAA